MYHTIGWHSCGIMCAKVKFKAFKGSSCSIFHSIFETGVYLTQMGQRLLAHLYRYKFSIDLFRRTPSAVHMREKYGMRKAASRSIAAAVVRPFPAASPPPLLVMRHCKGVERRKIYVV